MYLDVPFVSQLDFGGNQHHDDPTGCWYASACMIAYAFEAGPRQGVPELYSMPIQQADGTAATGHWAIEYGWLWVLKRNEHLVDLAGGMPGTPQELSMALRLWGPLMMFWTKTQGGQSYGHASVIIGVRNNQVIYHDPENAPNSEMPFTDATAKLMAGWPMLRRDALPFSYAVAERS